MIQTRQVGDAVMHIAGRHMGVGDDVVLAVHRAMIQIEKAFGLALAEHVAAVRIRGADFGLFDFGLPGLFL